MTKTSTVTKAEQAFEAARATVTEWTDKAAAARAEAAELDANSGALILADPTAADEIATRIHARQMTARTYDHAAAEARKKLADARREVLKAWADEYGRRAKATEQKLEKHNAAIDTLVEQIRELDGGHPWTLLAKEARDPNIYGTEAPVDASKAGLMEDEVRWLQQSAGHCRYVVEHGRFVNVPNHPLYGTPRPAQPFDVIGTPPWGEAPKPAAQAEQAPAPAKARRTDGHDELDPVEDADILRLMGPAR